MCPSGSEKEKEKREKKKRNEERERERTPRITEREKTLVATRSYFRNISDAPITFPFNPFLPSFDSIERIERLLSDSKEIKLKIQTCRVAAQRMRRARLEGVVGK